MRSQQSFDPEQQVNYAQMSFVTQRSFDPEASYLNSERSYDPEMLAYRSTAASRDFAAAAVGAVSTDSASARTPAMGLRS